MLINITNDLRGVNTKDFSQFLLDERVTEVEKIESLLNASRDSEKNLICRYKDHFDNINVIGTSEDFTTKQHSSDHLYSAIFRTTDHQLMIKGSVADSGICLTSLIRIDKLPDVGISEFHLDDLSEEYIVLYEKIPNEITEKKYGESYLHNVDAAGISNKPDLKSIKSADAAIGKLSEIADGRASHFNVSIWLIVRSSTEEDLREKLFHLSSKLKKSDHGFLIEKYALKNILNEFDLNNDKSLRYSFEIDNRQLARLLPLNIEKIHDFGVPFYSRSNQLQYIDFFDSKASNYNWLFTGESGKGKSYVANFLAFNLKKLYEEKITIGFFDLGGSMYKTASYLGAKSFSEKINPFLIKEVDFIYEFIILVIGEDEFDKHSKGELYSLVKEYLDSAATFKGLINTLNENFSSIQNIKYYFSRIFDYFTEDIVDVPNVYYLDFTDLPKELLPSYVFFVRSLAQKKYDRIANFYDEMWYYLKIIPDTLKADAKTARKKLEANFYFTQEVNELFNDNSEASNAIIGNTYGKVYFSQPYISAPILSEEEKEILKSVDSIKNEYSEFYVKTNNFKKILRLYPDPLIYELAQSERDRLKEQFKFLDKFQDVLSFKNSFDLYVRSKYAN